MWRHLSRRNQPNATFALSIRHNQVPALLGHTEDEVSLFID